MIEEIGFKTVLGIIVSFYLKSIGHKKKAAWLNTLGLFKSFCLIEENRVQRT
jgi:hypothetical protein